MSYIEIKNVSFSYDGITPVLENVNLSIGMGESVSIVGQNGAGKSTLAKMLNGLLKPTSGDILIDGKNTKKHTTAQLSEFVGYVFQNPDDQIFNDNVYDEIAFAPTKAGLDDNEVEDIVYEVAKVTGLSNKLDDNPYDLPYSIRKFVAIASILALQPQVVILDEPTAGQDKYGMEIIRDIINYLLEKGSSIVTITHDMEFTVANFNRTIVMANKKKIADASPKEIFWMPEILSEAQLKQPYVSRVARKSGLTQSNIVTVKEIVQEIVKKKGKKDE